MKLQDFLTGYIDKRPDGRYSFVVNGKVKGTYLTVSELVKAQSPKPKRTPRIRRPTTES